MDSTKLQKFRQQLRSRVPLLGAWLQGQAVKSLAEDGSAEAVRALEEAVAATEEEALSGAAFTVLDQLARDGNVPAREALCRLVIHYDHGPAREAVFQAGYLPHDEIQR